MFILALRSMETNLNFCRCVNVFCREILATKSGISLQYYVHETDGSPLVVEAPDSSVTFLRRCLMCFDRLMPKSGIGATPTTKAPIMLTDNLRVRERSYVLATADPGLSLIHI